MINLDLEKFQGPLALLLKLIEKQELDISEVSLAQVADKYLDYIERNEDIDAEEIADFLLIAARLMYLKSRTLLPYLEEDETEEDFTKLKEQLKLYKAFVEISQEMKEILALENISFFPRFGPNFRARQKLLESNPEELEISANELSVSYALVLAKLSREKKLPEKRLEKKISLEERMGVIRSLLAKQLSLSFQKILTKTKSKAELIVNILAVLELAKQRELNFEQDELFSEIKVSKFN